MTELIRVEQQKIGEEAVQTINARELHSFLEVGKDFSTWIKDRIDLFGFVENQDYVIIDNLISPKSGSAKARTRIAKDYHLSLDMAKELSMVERNEKGKQARLYFIECERRAKQTPVLETPEMQMARGIMAAAGIIEDKNKIIEYLQPKADALDLLSASEGTLAITDAAKALDVKPTSLFTFLSINKWIYRRVGSPWIAYQDKLQQGLLEHALFPVPRKDGSDKLVPQVRVTAKGMAKLGALPMLASMKITVKVAALQKDFLIVKCLHANNQVFPDPVDCSGRVRGAWLCVAWLC